MSGFEHEVEVARKAALEAGRIIRHYYGRRDSYHISSKGKDSPVTNADMEADKAIWTILTQAFPQYGWLSEESVDDPKRLEHSRVWIVDPLDGTKEFIKGIPELAVAIALAEDGKPVVGVTYNPIKEEMYWAASGAGCHLGDRRVEVTHTNTLAGATLLASRSETSRGEWETYRGQFKTMPTGSVAYKLALVAAGAADGTFTRSPKSEWDIASGAALLAEAGGRFTDIEGNEVRLNQRDVTFKGLIGSNPLLYPILFELVKRSGPVRDNRA